MIDKKLIYEAFNKSGWKIECESPLEVSYDENFANHSFAQIIIEDRIKDITHAVICKEIENWHLRDEENITLHDYLGFSWDSYKLYAEYNIVPSYNRENYLKKFIANPKMYLENL
jgi:hypothetical protein